jgi:chaperonin GroES
MLKPLGYGVLVKLDPVIEKSKGGILLAPDSQQRELRGQCTGTVVGLGHKAYSDSDKKWVKKGDKVFFRRYAGPFVKVSDEESYMVLTDVDILGIVGKSDKIEYIA